MSQPTRADRRVAPRGEPPELGGSVTFPRVVNSEWIKFRGMPAAIWLTAITVVSMVGLGLLVAYGLSSVTNAGEAGVPESAYPELPGVGTVLALPFLGSLGVLMVTGEWMSGSIRTTLIALRGRLSLLWAKALVIALVSFPVVLVCALIVHLGANPIIAQAGRNVSWSDPGVARHVVSVAGYATLIALMGLGIGAVVRNSVAGVVTLVAILLILPVVGALPWRPLAVAAEYLPLSAGGAFISITPLESMDQTRGLLVLIAWAAVALAAGAWRLARTDV